MSRIIYLDVDGVVSPDTMASRQKYWGDYKKYDFPDVMAPNGDPAPQRMWLSEEMGATIWAVADACRAEIVWSTTWGHQANVCIGGVFGWPELRVTDYDWSTDTDKYNSGKIPSIEAECNNHAIVVLDDMLGWRDKDWLDDRHKKDKLPTLGIAPRDFIGLTKIHLEMIEIFFLTQTRKPWALY